LDTVTFVIVVGLFFYLLTCIALIDIARKDFGSLGAKFGWGAVAFIPFIGCLIYFVFGFRKGIKPKITIDKPTGF
jgi:hypothetical protein